MSRSNKKWSSIILTGGEPTMQQTSLEEFIKYVKFDLGVDAYFEVETNGTILPNEYLLNNISHGIVVLN